MWFSSGREYNMIQAALEAGHSELVKLLIEAGGHLTGYYTGIAMGKVHYNILQVRKQNNKNLIMNLNISWKNYFSLLYLNVS